jgi:hypothetical protein
MSMRDLTVRHGYSKMKLKGLLAKSVFVSITSQQEPPFPESLLEDPYGALLGGSEEGELRHVFRPLRWNS